MLHIRNKNLDGIGPDIDDSPAHCGLFITWSVTDSKSRKNCLPRFDFVIVFTHFWLPELTLSQPNPYEYGQRLARHGPVHGLGHANGFDHGDYCGHRVLDRQEDREGANVLDRVLSVGFSRSEEHTSELQSL